MPNWTYCSIVYNGLLMHLLSQIANVETNALLVRVTFAGLVFTSLIFKFANLSLTEQMMKIWSTF